MAGSSTEMPVLPGIDPEQARVPDLCTSKYQNGNQSEERAMGEKPIGDSSSNSP
jgi:hypothetical protein